MKSFRVLSQFAKLLPSHAQRRILPYRPFSEATSLPPLKPRIDPVSLAIKSAHSVGDVLKIAGVHGQSMEPYQVLQSLRALYDHQKLSHAGVTDENIIRSQEFILLCKNLKRNIRALEPAEILDALKVITFLKINCKSTIVQSLLHMLKNDVNDLNIPQIAFLAYLLQKYPKDPVVDALKIALPIVFEAQLVTKLERKRVKVLKEALIFTAKNNVSRKCRDYIITALHELDRLEWLTMDPKLAKAIIIALSELAVSDPLYEAVYKDAVGVFCQNMEQFYFNEIDHILSLITRNSRRAPYLADENLLHAVAELGVSKSWPLVQCCIILRKLNPKGFVSRNLLDYMGGKIVENDEELRDGKFGFVKAFVSGLSVANYKTDYWNILKEIIPISRVFDTVRPTEPWMSFCIDLASLDIYNVNVLTQVFSQSFLNEYLAREYNKLDLLQLLRLYQAVSTLHTDYIGPWPPEGILQEAMEINGCHVTNFPLKGALHMALGGEDYVLTRCFADHCHFIDHVVVLRRGGHAVAFPGANENGKIVMDQISLPTDSLRVAIRFLSSSWYNSQKQLRGYAVLSQRVLEAQGYAVVNINQEQWELTPDWEKTPYLMQQIRLSSQEIYSEDRRFLE